MSEYSTPVSTETENDDERGDDGPGAANWAGAMAQIDAEIDELRALLTRRRAADEPSRDDDAGDRPDGPVA